MQIPSKLLTSTGFYWKIFFSQYFFLGDTLATRSTVLIKPGSMKCQNQNFDFVLQNTVLVQILFPECRSYQLNRYIYSLKIMTSRENEMERSTCFSFVKQRLAKKVVNLLLHQMDLSGGFNITIPFQLYPFGKEIYDQNEI